MSKVNTTKSMAKSRFIWELVAQKARSMTSQPVAESLSVGGASLLVSNRSDPVISFTVPRASTVTGARSMVSRLSGLAAMCVIVCTSSAWARPAVYDAAADFSITNGNPNGVWSYGHKISTFSDPFTSFVSNGTDSGYGFDFWEAPSSGYLPVMYNPTTSAIVWFTVEMDAGQLTMHPGELNQYAITRFTAPATGDYAFSADFIGQDYVIGTTSDVHVLVNDVPVFSDDINGFHDTASSGPLFATLLAGQTIEVAIGYGSNGDYFGDTTGVNFVVEAVPAPGAATLLGFGGLLAARRRR